ncbi:hypothetical protein GN958_ATG23000 [Phytophthora infestans]|uniref:Uncharacterized protein n=1 Tax=Phytophthora infestans TaxID=4787 RepID=A0A8S9TM17_PHYIN|nr:hypothetical protein GN958_ATG23000 [Phytophthora infestans]
MTALVTKRKELYGAFLHDGIPQIELLSVWLWDDKGRRKTWNDYRKLIKTGKRKHIKDLCEFNRAENGVMTFRPKVAVLTDDRGDMRT